MSKTTKIIIIVVVAAIIAGVAYWYFTKDKKKSTSTSPVKVADASPVVALANQEVDKTQTGTKGVTAVAK